jgi:exopolysaccharide biosynthesis predicted pyruvyltransferase EpsI
LKRYIRDAALIITDRLHVAVFGHLLGKRVVMVCGPGPVGEKLKGVYDFSMSGPDSRTSLYVTDLR